MKKQELNQYIKKISDYINVKQAQKLENTIVEKYKSEGWIILNRTKTGSLGSNKIKWTKETCFEEYLKYNKDKKKFRKNNIVAYSKCLRNKWLDEFISS